MLPPLQCRLQQIFFLDLVILTEHLASDISAVSSNSPVGFFPKTKIYY